ncbi:MAG: amphi-Trp domain-containing protein [Anaerolineae bacterium]|jgi:amphi-Trp domain-containing protein
MAKKKRVLIRSKEQRSTLEIAEFLRQLADRLEQNEVVLLRGDEETRLAVPDEATFKLRVKESVKKRKTKHQLKLTLRWQDGGKKRDLVQLA